jgi:hypothetical protein
MGDFRIYKNNLCCFIFPTPGARHPGSDPLSTSSTHPGFGAKNKALVPGKGPKTQAKPSAPVA